MPLLYSIEGLSTVYAPPPVAPVAHVFSATLSTEMGKVGLSNEGPPPPRPRPRSRQGSSGYNLPSKERERKPVLIAEQIMTTPAECVALDMALKTAHELMQSRRFRHFPVVSKERKLAGILSDRDVLRAGKDQDRAVLHYMSSRVLTATPETPIQQIAEALLQNRVGSLPIIDDGHRVVGIITTTDILKAIVQRAPLELWA